MESFEEWQKRERRIDEMTKQVNMVIKENPMIGPDDVPRPLRDRMDRNRELLRQDKEARLGPHGGVYTGIMNTRYPG